VRHTETEHEPPETPEDGPGGHAALSEEERLQKALDLAYAHLNRRDRTVSEVRSQLQRRGVSDELTETAIQTIARQGFLDDSRYARLFVADKRTLEQWGSERIRRGLLSHGIDRHLIEAALAEEPDPPAGNEWESGEGGPTSELDRAIALLRVRFPDPPQDRRDRNRALGMLLRKGYESELALDALAAYARGD
jgi:regulatory protein